MSEKIKEFRFWCQKVLPLVYDDSLSYYEVVCKAVDKLNEVVSSQNNVGEEMQALQQEFVKLKEDLTDVIESEATKVIEQFVSEHNLISTVNGIGADAGTGNITLKASDVGAIANVTGSVKTNNLLDASVTGAKIAQGAVTEGKIASGAVTAGKIDTGAVGEAKIADGAVSGAKLAAGAVSEGKIASGAVTAGKIATEAVATSKIARAAITTEKIANGAVDNDKVGTCAITDTKIADNAITARKITPNAVNTVNIVNKAVARDKIADSAITAEKIADGAVESSKVANNAIGEAAIADGSITPKKINGGGANNAGKLLKVGQNGVPFWGSGTGQVIAGVESVNGKDGTVTLTASDVGAIANEPGSVTESNVANDSISITKVKKHVSQTPKWNEWLKTKYPSASPENTAKFYPPFIPCVLEFDGNEISLSNGYGSLVTVYEGNNMSGWGMNFTGWCELSNNSAGKFYYVDNTNTVILRDITPENIGALSAGPNVIKTANLADGSVNNAKLWNPGAGNRRALVFDTDNSWKVVEFVSSVNNKQGNVTLTADDVGAIPSQDSAITANMLTDGCVTGDKVKDSAISTGKIVNLSVTSEKLASGSVTATKIADNSVTTGKVGSKAITEEKIADGAVTGEKLGDMSVGLAKMENLGAENAGKALVVQSNGDVGLGDAGGSDIETQKFEYASGGNDIVLLVSKTPWGTTLNFSAKGGVTVTSSGYSFSVPKGLFPEALTGKYASSLGTMTFTPHGTLVASGTTLPTIASSNVRFTVLGSSTGNYTVTVKSASGSVANVTGCWFNIPGV